MFLELSCFKPDGEPPFLRGQSMNQKKHWKKQQHNPGSVRVLDGSDGYTP